MSANKKLESLLFFPNKLDTFLQSDASTTLQVCSAKFETSLRKIVFQGLSKRDSDAVCIALRVIKYLAGQKYRQGIHLLLQTGLHGIMDRVLLRCYELLDVEEFDGENVMKLFMESITVIIPLQNDQCKWFQSLMIPLLQIILKCSTQVTISFMIVDSINQILATLCRKDISTIRNVICSSQDAMNMCKTFISRLHLLGDYQLQASVIELIVRVTPSSTRSSVAAQWNDGPALAQLFANITYELFDEAYISKLGVLKLDVRLKDCNLLDHSVQHKKMSANKKLESLLFFPNKLDTFLQSDASTTLQVCSAKFETSLRKIVFQGLSKRDSDAVCIALRVIKYLAGQKYRQGIHLLLQTGLHGIMDRVLLRCYELLDVEEFDGENVMKLFMESITVIIPLQNDQCKWFQSLMIPLLQIILKCSTQVTISFMIVDSINQILATLCRKDISTIRNVICSSQDAMNMCKTFISRLHLLGDYQLQASVIELIVRVTPSSTRSSVAAQWNDGPALAQLFANITYELFDETVRAYLNDVNAKPSQLGVRSLPATCVKLGEYPFTEQCWIDLCFRSRKLCVGFALPDDEMCLCYVVASLDKMLHDDYLCLVDSDKQQIKGSQTLEPLAGDIVEDISVQELGEEIQVKIKTKISLKMIFDDDVVPRDCDVLTFVMKRCHVADLPSFNASLLSILQPSKGGQKVSRPRVILANPAPHTPLPHQATSIHNPQANWSESFSQDVLPSSQTRSMKESKPETALLLPIERRRFKEVERHLGKKMELQRVKINSESRLLQRSNEDSSFRSSIACESLASINPEDQEKSVETPGVVEETQRVGGADMQAMVSETQDIVAETQEMMANESSSSRNLHLSQLGASPLQASQQKSCQRKVTSSRKPKSSKEHHVPVESSSSTSGLGGHGSTQRKEGPMGTSRRRNCTPSKLPQSDKKNKTLRETRISSQLGEGDFPRDAAQAPKTKRVNVAPAQSSSQPRRSARLRTGTPGIGDAATKQESSLHSDELINIRQQKAIATEAEAAIVARKVNMQLKVLQENLNESNCSDVEKGKLAVSLSEAMSDKSVELKSRDEEPLPRDNLLERGSHDLGQKSRNMPLKQKSRDKSIKLKSRDKSLKQKSRDESFKLKSRGKSLEQKSRDKSIEHKSRGNIVKRKPHCPDKLRKPDLVPPPVRKSIGRRSGMSAEDAAACIMEEIDDEDPAPLSNPPTPQRSPHLQHCHVEPIPQTLSSLPRPTSASEIVTRFRNDLNNSRISDSPDVKPSRRVSTSSVRKATPTEVKDSDGKKLRFSVDPYQFIDKDEIPAGSSKKWKIGRAKKLFESSGFSSAASTTSELSWVQSHKRKGRGGGDAKPVKTFRSRVQPIRTAHDRSDVSIRSTSIGQRSMSPESFREAAENFREAAECFRDADEADPVLQISSQISRNPDNSIEETPSDSKSTRSRSSLVIEPWPVCMPPSCVSPKYASPLETPTPDSSSHFSQCTHISTVKTPMTAYENISFLDKRPSSVESTSPQKESSTKMNAMHMRNNTTPHSVPPVSEAPSIRKSKPVPKHSSIATSSVVSRPKRLNFRQHREKTPVASLRSKDKRKIRRNSPSGIVASIEQNMEGVEQAWREFTSDKNENLDLFVEKFDVFTEKHGALMERMRGVERRAMEQLMTQQQEFEELWIESKTLSTTMTRTNDTFEAKQQEKEAQFGCTLSDLSRQVTDDLKRLMRS